MTTTTKGARVEAALIFAAASKAARAAVEACTPQPMIVGESVGLFSDRIDYSKPTYVVADGLCGFAWVRIRPARGAFVTWCKANNIGHNGYGGGWEIASWAFSGSNSQSYEKAMAAANAAAGVLKSFGITAYVDGRLD